MTLTNKQQDIYTKLEVLLDRYFGIEHESRKDDFINDLGMDSLDHVEMVVYIERDFCISITDTEAEKMTTIIEAIKLIETKY